MSSFAAGKIRSSSASNAAMMMGRCLCLLSGLVTVTALAQTHPQKQQPWCDFELPNCPSKPQGLPSSTETRKTGMDSPGWGKGIMEMPYGTAASVAEVKSRLADDVADCVSVAQDIQEASSYRRQRSSHPELAASDCVILDPEPSYYGGFVNTCDYQVEFRFCAFRPDEDAWTEAFDCEKTKGGMELIEPKQHLAAHTKNAQMIYWGGCRFPKGSPTDFEFHEGEGYRFRCFAWDDPELERERLGVAVKERHSCDALAIENGIRERANAQRLEAEQHRVEAEQRRQREQLALEEQEREERAAALKWQRDAEAVARRQLAAAPAPITSSGLSKPPCVRPQRATAPVCSYELESWLSHVNPSEPGLPGMRTARGQESHFNEYTRNTTNSNSKIPGPPYDPDQLRQLAAGLEAYPDTRNPEAGQNGQTIWGFEYRWFACYARARAEQIQRACR